MVVTLLILLSLSFASEWNGIYSSNPASTIISLEDVSESTTTIKISLDGYYSNDIEIENDIFTKISAEGGTSILKEGFPDLPQFTTSLIIPDEASMSIRVVDQEYIEIEDINVIPSKGNLSRLVNPADIDYVFSGAYSKDLFYPGALAYLRDPYILRDYRGQTVVFRPFQYNPESKILRVYTSLTIEVYEDEKSPQNIKHRRNIELKEKINREFQSIYDSHFINNTNTNNRFEYLEDRGNMLIISYGDFIDEMAPFVEWKNQMGVPTEIVNVSSIGSNSNSIKSYIEEYYFENGLTFLLLVGDINQIPSPSLSGSASDPSYGFIEGGTNDYYAEVIVGRFSANNPGEVTTQVDRSIEYEKYPQDNAAWYSKALGVASNQGPGMNGYTDDDFNEWMWDTILSNFTYDNYQGIYDPNGTDSQGTTAINNGVSIINYTGHGSISSWGNGASLSSSQINSLTNNNKLPFVITVGCNVGEFNSSTECFSEAWLRATNNGEPTGAIAHFGSTISQSWEPPMHGQWAMNKILTESYENNITRSIGGITTNGCMHMNDAQGSSGENETKYWTLFGDPSLWLRTDQSALLSIYHDNTIMIGQSEFIVDTGIDDALVSFSKNGELIDSKFSVGGITVMDLGSATNQPGDLDLIVTAFNSTPYIASISVMSTDGPYLVMDDYELSSTDILAGSSLSVSLTFQNIGNDDASDVSIALSSLSDYITINNDSDYISYLGSGSSATVGPFTFNVSSNAPFGHQFSLDFDFGTTDDSWSSNIDLSVGELVESFESADFSYLPWEFDGESDWSIDFLNASSGVYSARSGVLTDAEAESNITSDLSLSITTVEDGLISFAKKVSCEDVGSSSGNYYDYLAFYIDGVEQDKWAGESAWSTVSFAVSAGNHDLMWRFNKDQGVTSGDDAVWIDQIVFPPCDNIAGTLGDLNSDGAINVLDVITLVNMILGNSEPDYSSGDMNSDGALDVLDIVLIVNIILSN